MKKNNKEHKFEAPGTLVLVLIFLLFFVGVYVANWVVLGGTWPVR